MTQAAAKPRTSATTAKGRTKAKATPARKPATTRAASTTTQRLTAAIDSAATPTILCTPDLAITHLNAAARQLFGEMESDVGRTWPGFSGGDLLGQSADQFHQNPAGYRHAVGDPANLPHRAEIEIGDRAFNVRTSGQFDGSGKHLGFAIEWHDVGELLSARLNLEAIDRAQAVIEFTPDGIVLGANDNFQRTMGYSLHEVVGVHHRTFVDPAEAAAPAYAQFWDSLARGQSVAGDFPRLTKTGETVWLRASYNPIVDRRGNTVKVVKYATDITEERQFLESIKSQMEAIDRFQAVIEFTPDGTVVTANDNFLRVTGYTLTEIVGSHHRIFMDPVEAATPAYAQFWDTLARGQFVAADFPRRTKTGETIWIRASYNPIFDRHGNTVKVVKYATDITEEKRYQQSIEMLVTEASAVMRAVAEGDLTRTVSGEYMGDLVQLRDATNASIENLAGLVAEIRGSAVSMSSSAKEVALANQDLSRRTEAQASSLEETASSMEQMTATVQQNADNSRKASQLAVSAREQAQGGGQVVDQAVAAMLAISESSKKIADIIGVIDEIAFQTNLLALNAAVEAARAGDQGRGFAVVASEVRNLAQRSAGAAKEIKSLIQDSLAKVDDGATLVNQSGTQLTEIVGAVKKVSDIIAEIAAASEEQSAGITQVNQAVAEMDQGTQQNAAMVEEAAAAAESVQQLSQSLLELAEQFRISDAHSAAFAAAAAPTPSAAGNGNPGVTIAAARAAAPRPAPMVKRHAELAGADDDEVWQQF